VKWRIEGGEGERGRKWVGERSKKVEGKGGKGGTPQAKIYHYTTVLCC